MSERTPECMCDFPEGCAGTGTLHCSGCGGDLCVCAACFGHGETGCDGCDECPRGDYDMDDWKPEDMA